MHTQPPMPTSCDAVPCCIPCCGEVGRRQRMGSPQRIPCQTCVETLCPASPRTACSMASVCGSASRARPRGPQHSMPLILRCTRQRGCESHHPCVECWRLALMCCCAPGAWVCSSSTPKCDWGTSCVACMRLASRFPAAQRCNGDITPPFLSCVASVHCTGLTPARCAVWQGGLAQCLPVKHGGALTRMMVRGTQCTCLVGCNAQRCATLAATWVRSAARWAGSATCGGPPHVGQVR